MTLDSIAIQYGADKASNAHGYTAVYEKILGDPHLNVRRMLEIGVADGRSLMMWRDYLPDATVVGLDIDERCRVLAERYDRIEIVVGRQSDDKTLDKLSALGPFDLVVDDGSHVANDIAKSFAILWKSVRPGGYYVVEDTHALYHGLERDDDYSRFLDLLISAVDMSGKSGFGVPENDRLFRPETMTPLERAIESVEIRKSLLVVRFRKA